MASGEQCLVDLLQLPTPHAAQCAVHFDVHELAEFFDDQTACIFENLANVRGERVHSHSAVSWLSGESREAVG